jgi:hypothetical protein
MNTLEAVALLRQQMDRLLAKVQDRKLANETVELLCRTSRLGEHFYTSESPACVKCGGEMGRDVGMTCPSDEGLTG